MKHPTRTKTRKKKNAFKTLFLLGGSFVLFGGGLFFVWAATLDLPDVNSFNSLVTSQSSVFYDRTGKIELFNLHQEVKRTEISFDDISVFSKNATLSIEDAEFYQHKGIKPTAIIRAIFANVTSLGYAQGGSTITQQVVKNSLLTKNKSITRKLKEWILAVKIERVLSKDEIFSIYLNDAPFGGNIYGIEEASRTFFSVHAHELSLAQAAYLAALPQAPTYYSPYGNHKEALSTRKNLVLSKMLEKKYITQEEYATAKATKVTFNPLAQNGLTAPHFIFFIRDYLENKYGAETIDQSGFKITTTLNATLQLKAEEIVKKYALANKEKFDAENAGLIAVDPKTGQILAMVGSRNYFDKEIDGNVNVTLAKRQPGSSFKPFVYATLFKKGYTSETVLFDVKTEFSTYCSPEGKPLTPNANCYSPSNYDNKFRGPVTLREALAQSLNVPAVKVLYLAGLDNSLQTAKDSGITTLTDKDRFGLTLVLGGGEVTLLELTNAYGVFANDGVRNPYTGILKVEDGSGNIKEEYEQKENTVMDSGITREISDILSDNEARSPTFGERSALYFPGRQVAVKTGTTNNYKDAWVVGYTPSFVSGAWAGNNNNRSMQKKVAGQVVAPLWHEFMEYALSTLPQEQFKQPPLLDKGTLPPALQGEWRGGEGYIIDKKTGTLATETTPFSNKGIKVTQNVHSILYWITKNDPLNGTRPVNPEKDPQFILWETAVTKWAGMNGYPSFPSTSSSWLIPPSQNTSLITPLTGQTISLSGFNENIIYPFSHALTFTVTPNDFEKVSLYINNSLIGFLTSTPFYFSVSPRDIPGVLREQNTLKVVGVLNGVQKEITYTLQINLNQ